MSTNQLRLVGVGVFYLVIFGSGFWLSRSGKPYDDLVFNVHKLIALAGVVLFAVTLYRMNQAASLSPTEIVAGVVTGLFFLGLFVTGGLLSADESAPTLVTTLHHLLPYLALLSTAVTLYLVLIRK